MAFDLKSFGENQALFLEDKSRVTYKALDAMVAAFTNNFRKGRGLFLLEADNSLKSIVAYLAALSAQCPVVLTKPSTDVNGMYVHEDFSFLYRYSGVFDSFFVCESPVNTTFDPRLTLLLSTSGSTGDSKYVCLSWDNLKANALSIGEYLELSEEDRAPTNLPFYYSYGLSVVNSHLMTGGALLLTNMSVMVKNFWELFDHFGCTSFAGVPHTYKILDRLNFPTSDRARLRYTTQAGGKLSEDLILKNAGNALKEGWKFFVMYGQTEASPRMAYLPPDLTLEHPGCIGISIPKGRFTLEDEDGSEIQVPDVEGELIYTGPNVMLGYASCDGELDGFSGEQKLKTGDLACKNSSGLYYLTGRISRFIKLYGVRVSLDQVEEHLNRTGINAVCAGDDEFLNILVAGYVDGKELKAEIASWLGIPLLKVKIFDTDYIPVTSSGKIDIQKANAIIAENAGWSR